MNRSLSRFCGALRGVVSTLSTLSSALERVGSFRSPTLVPSGSPVLKAVVLAAGGVTSLALGVASSTGSPLAIDRDLVATTIPKPTRPTTTTTVPTTTTPTSTTTTSTTAQRAGAPGPFYFESDFETGDFSQWPHAYNLGPAHHPERTLSRVVDRPDGGKMAKFVVSESLARGNSRSGQMSMLTHEVNRAWEREGADTWYRVSILLPSGNQSEYPGKFHARQPTPEGWNTFVSWHEYGVGGMSPAIGRSTWCGHRDGCLQVKWVGGRGRTYYVDDRDPATGKPVPLEFDHWYDLVVHVRWSAYEDKGLAEVWVDGRKIFGPGIDGVPDTIATLWRHEDGKPAGTYLMLGHYRRHPHLSGIADYGDDTVYVDDLVVGPSREAVNG